MKPTLWWDGEIWICSCVDWEMSVPEDSEDYTKWACAGAGVTPQEAYAEWELECENFRKELEE